MDCLKRYKKELSERRAGGPAFLSKKEKMHLTIWAVYDIVNRHARCAALAQSVERRLGKAEVGGSSPLGSLKNS